MAQRKVRQLVRAHTRNVSIAGRVGPPHNVGCRQNLSANIDR